MRGAAQAADWATTSQDEADRARGRELREREERLGRLESVYKKQETTCASGDLSACKKRDEIGREIDALLPTIPVEPVE